MSRAQLLAAARTLGIRTDLVAGRKRLAKNPDALRIDVLERCYGRNLGNVRAKSAAEMDERVSRAADCAVGRLGYLLMVAQGSIADARNALAEWARIRELKRRRPDDEARLLRDARHSLEISDIAQRLHETEAGMRTR